MSDQIPSFDDDTNEHNQQTAPIDPQRTRPSKPTSAGQAPARPPQARTGTSHVQPVGQPPPRQRRQHPPRSYQQRPPRRSARARDSALYLPWWSLVLMLMGVLVIAFGLIGAVYLLRNPAILADPTPIIRIITAVPTQPAAQAQPTLAAPGTEVIAGGSTDGELALAGPTLEAIVFTPTPVSLQVGGFAIVEGVDAQTLNVRDLPNLNNSTILFRAEEGEIFRIVEGPSQSDGFTWWRLQDPNNPARAGWAVSNFLEGSLSS